MTLRGRIVVAVVGSLSVVGSVVGALFAKKTVNTTKNAVDGKDADGSPVLPPGAGVTVPLRLTGYWPYSARPDEQKMEGGITGAAGWPRRKVVDPATGKRVVLTTVEMHREDPIMHPHVSLSGDPDIWPWGQKLIIPWSDGKPIIGRVVDTGQHFTGANKVYRIVGREPLDVCVASSSTKVIAKTDATVVPGDHWDKQSADVALAKLGKPISSVGVSQQYVNAVKRRLLAEDSGLDILGAEEI